MRFDDIIFGDASDNTLRGFLGDDTLNGGGGDDILRGESGADTFVFEVGGGNDVIIDWLMQMTCLTYQTLEWLTR